MSTGPHYKHDALIEMFVSIIDEDIANDRISKGHLIETLSKLDEEGLQVIYGKTESPDLKQLVEEERARREQEATGTIENNTEKGT